MGGERQAHALAMIEDVPGVFRVEHGFEEVARRLRRPLSSFLNKRFYPLS